MSECILWEWATNDKGYPQIRINGKIKYVHVMMYEEAYGPVPEGFQVDHFTCHNRRCINAEHLRAATPAQNQQNRKGANRNNKTGVRGVYWSKNERRYKASIMKDGVRHHVGTFESLEVAEAAVKVVLASGKQT